MESIEEFLKKKLSDRNLELDKFASLCKTSKSTIYRLMKGSQKPSLKLEEKIFEILNLTTSEKQEFRYLSSVLNVEGELLLTRKEISNFFLKPYVEDEDSTEIELVYYDGEKYIKTFKKILEDIYSYSTQPEFTCKIKMVNCCNYKVLNPIYSTFCKFTNVKSVTIQHLINFSKSYSKENITVLKKIIPLISLGFYSVNYCENNFTNGAFNDFMLLDYEYHDESDKKVKKSLCIFFLKTGLSECFVVKDDNLKDFFERAYQSVLNEYKNALISDKSYEFIYDVAFEFENKFDVYLIKPNPCHNRIPNKIYKSLVSRFTEDKLKAFIDNLYKVNLSYEEAKVKMEELLLFMDFRFKFSYKNTQKDIFTREGLEKFASTGELSDHINNMPSFNKQEVREILEHIKMRNADKKDSYEFFILKENLYNEDLIFLIFKDYGILIEYDSEKYKSSQFAYCLLNQKNLSYAFLDFVDNYIPNMLAMPKQEADEFIDRLIKTYT